MGIYLPNMGIPESCRVCVAAFGGCCYVAPFSSDGICPDSGRPDWCPLVEVPPHGRLIDADALEDRCSRQAKDEWNKSTGTNWGYAYATFESDVEDAPTIIPAEEGK